MPRWPVLAEPLRRPADSAGGGGAPERHHPVRRRSEDLRARRQLPGARGGQPLRGGRELLLLERGGESGAHHHGQRAPRRRPPARAAPVSERRVVPADSLSAGVNPPSSLSLEDHGAPGSAPSPPLRLRLHSGRAGGPGRRQLLARRRVGPRRAGAGQAGGGGGPFELLPLPPPCGSPPVEPVARDGASYWPAAEWRRAAPEQVGLDAGKLAGLVQRLRGNQMIPSIHSLLVVR